MKKILNWVLAATLISGFTVSVTSCQDNEDNPAPAKKKYRLVQRKEVNEDTGAYYITDYGYDDQGRLVSYLRVGYNTQYSDGPYVNADYTFTYGDHYILQKYSEDSYAYFTLNDDGLIVKEQGFVIEDGVEDPRSFFDFQYEDGRVMSYEENGNEKFSAFHWEDGDLMYYGEKATEQPYSVTTFTHSELSVDHGYLKAPLSTMSEELYMMGYYGKPSKHLASHEKLEAGSKKMYTLFDRDYTYTIADGHIVEMVEVATTEIKTAVYSRSETKTTTTTFTYEEM